MNTNFRNEEIGMTNDELMTKSEIVGRLCQTPRHFTETPHNCPFLRPSAFACRAVAERRRVLRHCSSLSQRRGYFRARRRLKLESGSRDWRARLVRIRRHDSI